MCDNFFVQGNDYGNIQYVLPKKATKIFIFPNTEGRNRQFLLQYIIKTRMSSQKDVRRQRNQRQIKVEKGI